MLTDAGGVIELVGGGADAEWRRCERPVEFVAPVAVDGGTAPDDPLFIGSVAEEVDGIASGDAD